jgi:hypothetical protein
MWGWLVACGGGPEGAVEAAQDALEAGDRAAFGRAVDVEAVIPEIGAACAELQLVATLSDQELGRAPDPEAGLVGALTRAVLSSPDLARHHRETFEREFPTLPVDRCPALVLDPDHLSTERQDRDHAVVSWPVEVDGRRGEWRVLTERRDDGWHVAHVDGGALVEAWRAQELAEAADEARRLIAGLPDGAPHDDWQASRAWLRRHPEATAEAAAWEAAEAPLIAASGGLPAQDTAFFQPRGWFRNRHAGTTVANPGPETVARATIRFGFVDGDGAQVTAGDLDGLVVEVGPIAPGGAVTAASPASRQTWGDAARPVATVIAVTWEDGRSWRHPAVEAGRWSVFPTQ